jgi:FtsP/CotA-like multicopper oxidase with cupredoxin domain
MVEEIDSRMGFDIRTVLGVVGAGAFVAVAGAVGIPTASAATPVDAHAASPHCPPLRASRELVEPPDLDTTAQPTNARGERVVTLTALKDGDAYCYVYTDATGTHAEAPVLRFRQGERLEIRLLNRIAKPGPSGPGVPARVAECGPSTMTMADAPTMQVGYLNHLVADAIPMSDPDDTNLHLHGFIGPEDARDIFTTTLGNPEHACAYHLVVPAAQPPGLYFYHPHAHGSATDQMHGGLVGAYVVDPRTGPAVPRAAEHIVVLSDDATKDNLPALHPSRGTGIVAEFLANYRTPSPALAPIAYDPFAPPMQPSSVPIVAWPGAPALNDCDGRYDANFLAVDGAEPGPHAAVPADTMQLWRVLNATTETFVNLQLLDPRGTIVPMQVVGRDGSPVSRDDAHPLARYAAMDAVPLPPASRVEFLAAAPKGMPLTLVGSHACTGPDGADFPMTPIVTLDPSLPADASGAAAVRVATAPLDRADDRAAALLAYAHAHPELVKRRAITMSEYAFKGPGKGIHPSFFVTDTTDRNFREHSYAPTFTHGVPVPDRADIVVKRGTVEAWTIYNVTEETHALHVHQMNFAVDAGDPDGTANAMLDTVTIPAGTMHPNAAKPDYPMIEPSATTIVMDFRNVPPSTFMMHCHMGFHAEHGMVAIIKVVP